METFFLNYLILNMPKVLPTNFEPTSKLSLKAEARYYISENWLT